MASVDGNSVISLKIWGLDTGAGENLQEITRPHVDGIAYRKVGKRGRTFQGESIVDVASAASAKTTFETYKATQGSLVTVVDDAGNSWTNVAVLAVRRAGNPKRTYTPVGGEAGGGWLLRARWVFQMTETS
jgi:hypothetical protein